MEPRAKRWLAPPAEQRGRGAGGDASARRRDRAGHPRQRAHLEDNAAAAQLLTGTRGAEGMKSAAVHIPDKRNSASASGGFVASSSVLISLPVLCILHIRSAPE